MRLHLSLSFQLYTEQSILLQYLKTFLTSKYCKLYFLLVWLAEYNLQSLELLECRLLHIPSNFFNPPCLGLRLFILLLNLPHLNLACLFWALPFLQLVWALIYQGIFFFSSVSSFHYTNSWSTFLHRFAWGLFLWFIWCLLWFHWRLTHLKTRSWCIVSSLISSSIYLSANILWI